MSDPGGGRDPRRTPKPPSSSASTLVEAEIARLKAENEALMTQFAIWAYNSHVLGIPDHRLDAPLQPVNRDYSEGGT